MRLCFAVIIAVALTACDDDPVGVDGGPVDDAGLDASGDDDGGAEYCDEDDDCSDQLYCNGIEYCLRNRCKSRRAPVCSNDHPCLEETRGCDCRIPDKDQDNSDAIPCGGEDCDDTLDNINEEETEVCRSGGDGVDEDCDPTTFQNEAKQDGDDDNDGHVNANCYNIAPNGKRSGGDDCLDNSRVTHPDAREICDYIDNDCDEKIDEGKEHEDGPIVQHGLQVPFYPDGDRDGYPDLDAGAVRFCDSEVVPGRMTADHPDDCDDGNRDINIAEQELCDGVDNDCDGFTDKADDDDQPLLKPVEFTETELDCMVPPTGGEPRWMIVDCPGDPGDPDEKLWCSDVVDFGCTVDATSIDNCRDCGNRCSFACGRDDCDEIETVATGLDHSCAKTTEGNIACWGRGSHGQLGNDHTNARDAAVAVLGVFGARTVVAGGNSACAVVGQENQLFCWGSNASHQLGNADAGEFAVVPFSVNGSYFDEPTLSQVLDVAMGREHACAVLETGDLVCWGSERYGRLANSRSDEDVERIIPITALNDEFNDVVDAEKVAVGERHGCMIALDKTVSCWGDNSEGQLGDPSYTEMISSVVRPVPGIANATEIAAGDFYTCVVSDGEVICWGNNGRLQLGHADDERNGTPTVVAGLSGINAIAAGVATTCAIDEQKALWCWGGNPLGGRGDGSSEDRAAPTMLSIDRVNSVAVGPDHACASIEGGTAFCWGVNLFGQLGDGRQSDVEPFEPHKVAPREE